MTKKVIKLKEATLVFEKDNVEIMMEKKSYRLSHRAFLERATQEEPDQEDTDWYTGFGWQYGA